jgi:hypothetical protein
MALGINESFWVGTVEDINDPLQLGRAKIRIYGIHSLDKNDTPTRLLPWSIPIQPIYSAAFSTIGISPTGLLVQSTVIGFFADTDKQIPVMLGTIAGMPAETKDGKINDIPAPARGVKDYDNDLIGFEPPSKFSQTAKYPYNQVWKTQAGHLIELDSTPKDERIQIRHATGTYLQIDNTGTITIKTVDETYNITKKNRADWVGKDWAVKTIGNKTESVEGELIIETQKSRGDVMHDDWSIEVGGNMAQAIDGTAFLDVGGNTEIRSDENMKIFSAEKLRIFSDKKIVIKAPKIRIESGTPDPDDDSEEDES